MITRRILVSRLYRRTLPYLFSSTFFFLFRFFFFFLSIPSIPFLERINRFNSPLQLTLIGHVIVWFLMRYAFSDVRLGLFRNVPSSFFHTYVIAVCSYDTEERCTESINQVKVSSTGCHTFFFFLYK